MACKEFYLSIVRYIYTIPRTTGSDPNFFRIPTPKYGYGKSTGTGENSKEVTEYGTKSEVFENTKYGYGTMTEFFLESSVRKNYGYGLLFKTGVRVRDGRRKKYGM